MILGFENKFNFKRIAMKYFCLIILCLFSSCTVRDEDLKDYMWKFSGGLYLGDVLRVDFKTLENDTIYVNEKPKYFIKTSIGYFGFPTELIIKDIKSGKEGRYVGK